VRGLKGHMARTLAQRSYLDTILRGRHSLEPIAVQNMLCAFVFIVQADSARAPRRESLVMCVCSGDRHVIERGL